MKAGQKMDARLRGHDTGYWVGLLMQGAIQLYRHSLSYFLGRQCRFTPTCSEYALEAIRRHGPAQGGLLAVKRLCKCRPFGGHGFDPVPPPDGGKQESGIRKTDMQP